MKVLLASDGSDASREAEWFLSRMPFPEPIELLIANVMLVPSLAHLRQEFPASVNEMLDQYRDHAEALLREEAACFEGINGTIETCLRSGNPADQLVELATERGCDLVVLGARGHTRSQRFLLGSVSQKVARHAPCSVLVTRPSPDMHHAERPLRILVCDDGSPSAERAVGMLSRFHWGRRVELTVLSIVTLTMPYGVAAEPLAMPLVDEQRRLANAALERAARQLQGSAADVRCELREADSAAAEILDSIERASADLVVVGSRGLSRIERFFLGSTSENVLRHAPCSVWIVREPPAG